MSYLGDGGGKVTNGDGMTVEDVCGAQGFGVVHLLGGCVGDYGCEAEDFAEDLDYWEVGSKIEEFG